MIFQDKISYFDSFCNSIKYMVVRWCSNHPKFFCNYSIFMVINDLEGDYLLVSLAGVSSINCF